MTSDSEDDDERPWEEALRNSLILQNIFQFLSTGFILSSCSLVNKSWNNETRTFIRGNRKCAVRIAEKTSEFLKKFDEFCGEIVENGRIVPFNSFTTSQRLQCSLDSRDDQDLVTPTLTSQIKFFHFDIDCRSSWSRCSVHKSLFALLQHKRNQLQSSKVEFTFTQPEDDAAAASLFEKIIEAKPQLKTLTISALTYRRSILSFGNNDLGHQQQRFDTTLEKLLEFCHKSLRTISIADVYEGLGRLSHPPLINLSKFRMDRIIGDRSSFYRTLSTIDYARKMPRLQTVEFLAPLIDGGPGNSGATANSCPTVRNLTLTITSTGANLPFFEHFFPNVASLKLTCSSFLGALPFNEIWKLWPRLEELEIHGVRVALRDGYDSQFCGIHPEEAEVLRGKDAKYLRGANTVPITYSIHSMRSLRKLRIDLNFWVRHSPDRRPKFITKVTELNAFGKLPDMDILVIWGITRYPESGVEEKYSIFQSPHTINNEFGRKVLEEPRLLHKIFSYIPTSSLLSSCSLVSEDWNAQVRKFVIANRKCTARIADGNSTCELVRELDQLCCGISNEGRQIPWNRVRVNFGHFNGTCIQGPDGSSDEIITVTSQLRPNYLELRWKFPRWRTDCPAHKPLQALLDQCGGELRILKIANLSLHFGHLLSGCAGQFPKLEEILISNLPDADLSRGERLALSQALRMIVEKAPNLQKISAKDTESLELIPEDAYGLLNTLKFHFRDIQDENLYLKVAGGKPALRKLRIFQPFPVHVNEYYAPASKFREAFNTSLEQLLEACHQTVEVISIESVRSLSELSFSPLKNLRKLKLRTTIGPLESFSNALISIDFGRSMPGLEEVEIQMANLVEMESTSRTFFDGAVGWPCFDENRDGLDVLRCSNSVRKLTLELHVTTINFSLLHSIFPDVTSLEFRGTKRIRLKRDSLPFSEIFQFWPDLQELRIFGAKHFPNRDYDSHLCGIHEEEAELLRSMNTDFLDNVQIVPVKSSLLSMTSVQKLWIKTGVGEDLELDQSNPSQSFMFTVAERLAFRRVPHLKAFME